MRSAILVYFQSIGWKTWLTLGLTIVGAIVFCGLWIGLCVIAAIALALIPAVRIGVRAEMAKQEASCPVDRTGAEH